MIRYTLLYHIYGSMTLDFVQCIYDFFKLFSLNLNTVAVHDNPASVNIFFGSFTQFLFANAEVFGRFFNRQRIFFPDRHISIVHNLCTPFTVCLFISYISRQTALESSISISTIPILVGRTAPCGRIIIL